VSKAHEVNKQGDEGSQVECTGASSGASRYPNVAKVRHKHAASILRVLECRGRCHGWWFEATSDKWLFEVMSGCLN
jgi:hypothetical protein